MKERSALTVLVLLLVAPGCRGLDRQDRQYRNTDGVEHARDADVPDADAGGAEVDGDHPSCVQL